MIVRSPLKYSYCLSHQIRCIIVVYISILSLLPKSREYSPINCAPLKVSAVLIDTRCSLPDRFLVSLTTLRLVDI